MEKTYRIHLILNHRSAGFDVAEEETLLSLIRERTHLTGTKCGCGLGECGACTVLLNGRAVNSCCVPAVMADGGEVETIEGIGTKEHPHPLQTAFVEAGAIQCGFCTPGMIMSAKGLLDRNPDPTRGEIREALSGNLCRCTGYAKIEEAVRLASDAIRRMQANRSGQMADPYSSSDSPGVSCAAQRETAEDNGDAAGTGSPEGRHTA